MSSGSTSEQLSSGLFWAPKARREIQLTDAIRELLKEEPVYGYRYAGQRHDIGNPQGYLETAVAYARDAGQLLR